MKRKFLNNRGFAPALLIIVVVLIATGFFIYQTSVKNPSPIPTSPVLSKSSMQAKIILTATTTKTLDPQTGSSGIKVNTFLTTDPVIYLTLQVNKPPKGTKFEYVRYYNGKYVDHKSLETTKDGIDYVSFNWKLKDANSKHFAGEYRVKLYTNGKFEEEVLYSVH